MDFSKVNNWFSFATNLGVLVGVFLVAYELQQNRLATEAQTRSNISQMSFESTLRWAESPQIISTLDKVRKGEILTDQEELVMTYLRAGEIRRWENSYYQYERGLFDEAEFIALTQVWRDIINGPVYEGVWDPTSNAYSANFVEFINSLLED